MQIGFFKDVKVKPKDEHINVDNEDDYNIENVDQNKDGLDCDDDLKNIRFVNFSKLLKILSRLTSPHPHPLTHVPFASEPALKRMQHKFIDDKFTPVYHQHKLVHVSRMEF